MKSLLLILTLAVAPAIHAFASGGTKAPERVQRILEKRGYFFKYMGHVYFTEHLNSTFPQYLINWKNPKVQPKVCISDVTGHCPSYVVQFHPVTSPHGETILTNVDIVPPFNDPDAQLQFYKRHMLDK